MKILITGGAGGLGSELSKKLSIRGFKVRIFDLPNVDYSKVESLERTEIFKGDITKYSDVQEAVREVDAVLHLAAILPPVSEFDKERTMRINGGGTKNIVDVLKLDPRKPLLVFASSVCVYGVPDDKKITFSEEDFTAKTDYYSESKIYCEQTILNSGVKYIILRISGIVMADFFEFPDILQFSTDQRIEFICRDDVTIALLSALEKQEAVEGIFILAGGKTWQMKGKEYISKVCEIMEVPLSEVRFPPKPTWFNWYDTYRSQLILGYQNTTFDNFLTNLKVAVRKAYGI